MAAAWPASASSQNLILNPDFDAQVVPWENFAPHNGSTVWSDFDRNGDPNSGALLVVNSHEPMRRLGTGAGVLQFIQPTGDVHYVFGVSVFVPAMQTFGADISMEVQFYQEPEGKYCAGLLGQHFLHASRETEMWLDLRMAATAPPGTTCALVALETYPDGFGEDFVAYFDAAFMIEALFADGFESGSVSAWSWSVP